MAMSAAPRSTRLPLPACFTSHVDDFHSGPWTANRTYLRMYSADWAAQPVETHSLTDLHATQPRLLSKRLDAQRARLRAAQPEQRSRKADRLPWVIVWDDQVWIVDGHHRLAVAAEQGHTTFQAFTLRLTSSPQPTDGSDLPLRHIPA